MLCTKIGSNPGNLLPLLCDRTEEEERRLESEGDAFMSFSSGMNKTESGNTGAEIIAIQSRSGFSSFALGCHKVFQIWSVEAQAGTGCRPSPPDTLIPQSHT